MLIDKVGDMFFFDDIKGLCNYLDLSYNEVYAIIHYCRRRLNRYSPKHNIYIQRLFNNVYSHQPNEKMLEWNMDRKNQLLIWWINIKANGKFKYMKPSALSKIEYADCCENFSYYKNIIENGKNNL